MFSNIFIFLNDWVEKSQKKFENEWRKDENSFCDEEIHGIILPSCYQQCSFFQP
jgi:hypothetical protein